MPAPTLEELRQTSSAPTLDELKATSGSAADANLLHRAVEFGLAGSERLSRNLGSGAIQGLSGIDATGANLFMVLDGASHWLSQHTGLSYGGAFGQVEGFLRRDSETLMRQAEALSPGETLPDRFVQLIGALPGEIAQAVTAVAAGGPIAGFAGLGGLRAAHEGPAAAAIGAATGAALGTVFKATEAGPGRLARAATVGTAAGALEAAQGHSPEDVALGTIATGALAGITARPFRPPTLVPRGIPDAVPSVEGKPRLKRAGVLAEGPELLRSSAVEAAPKATVAAPKTHPAVVVTPRTQAFATEFLGRDYSDVVPPDRVMNLNLQRLIGPDDLKAATADFVEAFRNQIDQARRGTISHEQTQRLANDLGLTPDQLLARRRGQALNAEEAVAYRVMNRSALEQWHQAAKKIQSGKATDLEKAEFLRATAATEAVLEQTLGATAEAGRALSSFNIRVGPSTVQMRHLQELIRDWKGAKGKPLEAFAEQVATIDTPEGLAKLARGWRKATTGDKLMEVWINGLLSGPQTHVVNTLSNQLVALWSIPQTFGAAVAGEIAGIPARLRGEAPSLDRVRFREAFARSYGLLEGTADGLRLAAKVLRTGNPASPHELFGPVTTLDTPRQALGGKVGHLIRLPSRALMAEDAFFQAVAFRQELRAQAARKALSEGHRGPDLARRITELASRPDEAQLEAAYRFARRQTFTEELGSTGRAIQNFATSHHMARLILPFVRTPMNILKTFGRQSPFAPAMDSFRAELRKGGAARDTALAQMAMGSMVMAWAASLAAGGEMTGSGPADEELRRVWMLDNQPFSVKIGDSWVSYARVEPLASLLGVAADYSDISGHIDSASGEELVAALALSFRRNIANKTFLQGFSTLAEAISDPQRFGDRFLQQLSGSVVPSAVAQYARTQDPVLRDTRGAIDRIRSRIPGYSADLPPLRNVWGEPILLSGGVGPDLISPFYRRPLREDFTTSEAIRLRAELTQPDKGEKLRGMELSAQEFSELMRDTGQTGKQMIDRFVTSPVYRNIPDPIKKRIMEDLYGEARRGARSRAFLRIAQQDPVRIRQAIEQRVIEAIGPLPENPRRLNPNNPVVVSP